MQTDMISSLLEKPFSSRTFDEKREIVERGKPKPDMKDLTTVCKGGTKTVIRKFSSSKFDEIPWLQGCQVFYVAGYQIFISWMPN